MELKVIINPISGGGRGGKIGKFFMEYLHRNNIKSEIFTTAYREHAVEIAENNVNNDDRVIIVGGDGTVNEVVNGIKDHGNVIFGLIPVGSGDDFARSLNLRKNAKENFLIATSKSPKIVLTDCWNVDVKDKDDKLYTKKFVNSCGTGFDALVAFLNQREKVIPGLISYIYTILRALKKYQPIKMNFNFGYPNESKSQGDKLLFAIGNGKTAGGGLYLTPQAINNDGILNATTISHLSRLSLLRKLPLAIINKIETVREAEFYQFKSCKICLSNPYFVHIDGEIITPYAKEITIKKSPQQVRFINGMNDAI